MNIDKSVSAIVVGGASGLGEATALALRTQGAKVAILDANEDKGDEVAKKIGAIFCKVDVTSDSEVDAAFDFARSIQGQERILVNCAGIGPAAKTAARDRTTGGIKRFPIDVFNRVIQVNLIGMFRCVTKSAAGMLTTEPVNEDGERGVIINTASVAAEDGQMGQAAYSASKGGIVSLTLPIARDLMADGIRTNTIMPGIFDTPLMMGAPENVKTALAASVPFPKRFGQPNEFASMALEIIRNGYMNGATIRLDGAIRMAPR